MTLEITALQQRHLGPLPRPQPLRRRRPRWEWEGEARRRQSGPRSRPWQTILWKMLF